MDILIFLLSPAFWFFIVIPILVIVSCVKVFTKKIKEKDVTCVCCKKEIGFWDSRLELREGNALCKSCCKLAGIDMWSSRETSAASRMRSEDLIRIINSEKTYLAKIQKQKNESSISM
jgi:hypothetical protein